MLLRDQDRSLWDQAQIAEGGLLLDRALALQGRGPYVLQAAIAALHADDPVDWPQIAALYGELARLHRLTGRRAEPRGRRRRSRRARAGLELIDRLELDDYRYLHATRAELLRRLDRNDEARLAYSRALELAHADHERRFLERQLAAL